MTAFVVWAARNGKVHLPRIIEATDPTFGYAAVQAVVEWLFDPPKSGGKPVVVRAQVPFEFAVEAQKPISTPSKAVEKADSAPLNGEKLP